MSNSLISVRVQAMRYEAKGIVSVEMVAPDAAELPPFEAGAHIDLHLGNGIVRSYSLLNAPTERHRYVVGVLNDRNSRGGSRYVHEQLRVGSEMTISAPRNNFQLDEAASHSVLIAGGIGITPISCMLNHLRSQGKSAELLYCARSRAEAAFSAALLQQSGVAGHFDDEQGAPPDLRAYLASKPKDAHFYCCGPTPMLNAFETLCAELDLPNVHIERFAATENVEAVQSDEYVAELARSKKTISVPAGKSLLDALLDAGLDVEHSCREGVCGACETRVLEGEPEHRDGVLSKSERASNKMMMVCVSGCKGKRLVLDL
ncbi:2Fe-2S iron-sulfur cluster binding domain protein [Collimonas arenae]|uniref:2Fe-2S iron-sulfur cluster binding domain protein n=1 Tax=Collimonas arenae TaxID=279058 RepID=A0A127PP98_9BURK|nr:PDR/VanB family oxidoreductase [Collimonas arenae]AMO99626.1 2Fe-2S iron-sulfur cluster binding domain protein [Collimonas arenae]AMP09523.1 2Fe-2S iron-sulfur cluster binding domain protein [Collimonas arenae]